MSLLPEGTSGHALADSRVDEGDPLPGSSTSQPLALFGRGKPESAQRSAQHGAVDKPGSVCPLSSDEGILPEVQLGDDSSARVPKHIPGAGASSIRIWASWSNWHQDLFASSTPFSRFYEAQYQFHYMLAQGENTTIITFTIISSIENLYTAS